MSEKPPEAQVIMMAGGHWQHIIIEGGEEVRPEPTDETTPPVAEKSKPGEGAPPEPKREPDGR
jgi:hypothetical protein